MLCFSFAVQVPRDRLEEDRGAEGAPRPRHEGEKPTPEGVRAVGSAAT